MRRCARYHRVHIPGVHQRSPQQQPLCECRARPVYPQERHIVVLQPVGASHALVQQVARDHQVYPVRLQPGFPQDVPHRPPLEQRLCLFPGFRAALVVLYDFIENAPERSFVLGLSRDGGEIQHRRLAEAHGASLTVFHEIPPLLHKQPGDVVDNAVHHRRAHAVNYHRPRDDEHLRAQPQHVALALEFQRRGSHRVRKSGYRY
ncbi:unknown [Eubacterium sp. CAG:786]|nr:unknown [Eubacterium sp. CAG:786]